MSAAGIPIHSKDAISSSITDTMLPGSAERRVKIILISRNSARRGTSIFPSREEETCNIASTKVRAPESRYGTRFKVCEGVCEQQLINKHKNAVNRTDREPIAFHRPMSSETETSRHREPLDSFN